MITDADDLARIEVGAYTQHERLALWRQSHNETATLSWATDIAIRGAVSDSCLVLCFGCYIPDALCFCYFFFQYSFLSFALHHGIALQFILYHFNAAVALHYLFMFSLLSIRLLQHLMQCI